MAYYKDIRNAAATDVLGYVVGLLVPAWTLAGVTVPALVPVSAALAGGYALYRRVRGDDTHLDWVLADWPALYPREIERTVRLPHHGRRRSLPQVLVHANETAGPMNLRIATVGEPFGLSSDVRARIDAIGAKVLVQARRSPHFADEQNARLVQAAGIQGGLTLTFQPVMYSDYLRTNLLLDYRADGRSSLRSMVHGGGALEALQDSKLANILGVNVLVFTADGTLIMQRRSRAVAFRRGELAPAGSGSFSWYDATHTDGGTLKPMTVLRELSEEIGTAGDQGASDNLVYLGLTRELTRGGTPEIFFVTHTSRTETEIRASWRDARDRWEASGLEMFHFGACAFGELTSDDRRHAFMSTVDAFLDRHLADASIPLLTAVALWADQRLRSTAKLLRPTQLEREVDSPEP